MRTEVTRDAEIAAMLGTITTQVYAQSRPARLEQAVWLLRGESARGTDEMNGTFNSAFEELVEVPQTRRERL